MVKIGDKIKVIADYLGSYEEGQICTVSDVINIYIYTEEVLGAVLFKEEIEII